MDYDQHYAELFRKLESEYGRLEDKTICGIVGFSAGGPVNICQLRASKLFVTSELSVYPEQVISTDGLKFEIFSQDDFDEQQARSIFTALGALSMSASLGNGHTVDVTEVDAGVSVIKLYLYSQTIIKDVKYGLYRCRPA